MSLSLSLVCTCGTRRGYRTDLPAIDISPTVVSVVVFAAVTPSGYPSDRHGYSTATTTSFTVLNETDVQTHDAPHPTTLTALAALHVELVELRRNESAQMRRRRSVESRNHRSTFASEPERCQGETIFGPTALDRVRMRRRSGTQRAMHGKHGPHGPAYWDRAAPHLRRSLMSRTHCSWAD